MIDHRAIRLELQKALTKDKSNPNLTPVQKTVHSKIHGTTYTQTFYVSKPKPKSSDSSSTGDSNWMVPQGGKFHFGGSGVQYTVTPSHQNHTPPPKSPSPTPQKPVSVYNYQKPTTSRMNPRKSLYPGSFPDLAAAEKVLGKKGDPKGQFEIWNNILTTAQLEAIYRYTGIFYKMMNGLARGTIKESDLSPGDVKLAKKYTKLVEQALSEYELTSDVVFHRQVSEADMLPKFQKAFASPDKTFMDEGFFSTTVVMDSFNKPNSMDLIIKVPAGKGRGAWIKHLSRFPDEKEFLLNNFSIFTVDSIKQDQNGRWQVVLTWKGRNAQTN